MAITKLVADSITSGVAGVNTPAFEATTASDLTLTSGVQTKYPLVTEIYDTDSCYDTTTYRFTPNVAGKYFVYAKGFMYGNVDSDLKETDGFIFKNGSGVARGGSSFGDWPNANLNAVVHSLTAIHDMNGTTDYLEFYVRVYTGSGSTGVARGGYPVFGAYKIIE